METTTATPPPAALSAVSAARPGLVRALGPLMATAVVVGTVIGSGVFRKAHVIARDIDQFGLVALAWVLGGTLALLGSLAYAEVAVLYPRAGGNYVFLREGYGRLAGFLWGWVEFWIIRGASLAALATVFTDSLGDVLRESFGTQLGAGLLGVWEPRLLTVGVILALATVNVRGVRWGGGLQVFITTIKVGSLLGILVLPWLAPLLAPAGTAVASPAADHLQPIWPEQWDVNLLGHFGAALLGVLWAYHGWMNIAPVAEEVKAPQRNLPLSLLAGVGLVIFVYLGANLAYCLVLPQKELALPSNEVVVAAFGRALLGPAGLVAASAALMCSAFGALNGNLLVGPRLLYAMGEDGLAPRALGTVHPRYHTPALAILVLAAWACLLVLGAAALADLGLFKAKKAGFDVLTDFAMFGAVIFETLALSTIFVFRYRLPLAERPYRCPGYPVVPALYVLILALVAANMFVEQQTEALIGLAFIAVGVLVYGVFLRRAPAGGLAER